MNYQRRRILTLNNKYIKTYKITIREQTPKGKIINLRNIFVNSENEQQYILGYYRKKYDCFNVVIEEIKEIETLKTVDTFLDKPNFGDYVVNLYQKNNESIFNKHLGKIIEKRKELEELESKFADELLETTPLINPKSFIVKDNQITYTFDRYRAMNRAN